MRKIIDSRVVSITEDMIEGNPVLLVSPYGHFIAYYDLKNQTGSPERIQQKKLFKTLI